MNQMSGRHPAAENGGLLLRLSGFTLHALPVVRPRPIGSRDAQANPQQGWHRDDCAKLP
jgi:hypothetical protein